MQVTKIFEERVRLRLKDLSWTHADLAKRLGIAGPSVSQTLSDGRAPRIDTLLRWADALGVSVEWLLGREGTPNSPTSAVVEISPSQELDLLRGEIVRLIADADKIGLRLAIKALKAGKRGAAAIGHSASEKKQRS